MIKIIAKASHSQACTDSLTLAFDLRQKARLQATLDSGAEAGLFLPRGDILRHGDVLKTDTGECIQVIAAQEQVSTVRCADQHLFARACSHLGNRHVPLEIRDAYLRYQHDHVLDDMLLGLGLHVIHEQAPFEPEAGAYAHHHSHPEHTHGHE